MRIWTKYWYEKDGVPILLDVVFIEDYHEPRLYLEKQWTNYLKLPPDRIRYSCKRDGKW